MKYKYIVFFFIFFLAGCGSHDSNSAVRVSATDIIKAAADAAPGGVNGLYTLRISATGQEKGTVYLDTESNYRSPRNITVELAPHVVDKLIARNNQQPDELFVNHYIVVGGKAKRVRIDFLDKDGKRTQKHYYQTRIKVSNIHQIKDITSQMPTPNA